MTEKKQPEREEKPTATETTHTGRLFSGGPVNVEFVSRLEESGYLRDAIERMREQTLRDIMYVNPSARLGTAIPAQEADGEGELDELRDEVEDWIVEVPEQSFDDVVGNREALQTLIDAVRAPVEDRELYEHYGLRMPRGALLQGPPGCGKTMFARAVASEMRRLYGDDVEMLSLPGGSMQSQYVGQTEKLIRDVFAFARQYRKVRGHPLLVFIDEAEAILPDRSGKYRRVHSWEQSQVATFLAEMDGLEESGAFVLLASNMPEMIDSAILRDGRCDVKARVVRPDRDALEEILRRSFEGRPTEEGEEALVFAAVESFLDPSRTLLDLHSLAKSMKGWFESRGVDVEDEKQLKRMLRTFGDRNFGLEHIVSGAMAAGLPERAARIGFARDRADGTRKGITSADVVDAVTQTFVENRGLDHSYALREFMDDLSDRMREAAS
jgi:SpoVK/Ycf46/Vps4 family AAA+-type ATPase